MNPRKDIGELSFLTLRDRWYEVGGNVLKFVFPIDTSGYTQDGRSLIGRGRQARF